MQPNQAFQAACYPFRTCAGVKITQALHCVFGVVSIFFFFIKYLIETEQPHIGLARAYLSQLDTFSSGIHPHLLDRSETEGGKSAPSD